MSELKPKRPKYGGRQKGAPNRLTADVKTMIRNALDGAGGEKYLLAQAKKKPVAFMTLIGKIIPTDVSHSGAIATADITLTEAQKKAGLEAILRYQIKHKED